MDEPAYTRDGSRRRGSGRTVFAGCMQLIFWACAAVWYACGVVVFFWLVDCWRGYEQSNQRAVDRNLSIRSRGIHYASRYDNQTGGIVSGIATRTCRHLTLLFCIFLCDVAVAEPIRVATFNVALARKGPGLLLRDLVQGRSEQILNIISIIQHVRPNILLINEFDHDYENIALQRFSKELAQGENGVVYPYFYAPAPNTGVPSGMDLNQNGRLGDPNDAFGYGTFRGQYGMALLSQFPINAEHVWNFSNFLWRQHPNVVWPQRTNGQPFLSAEVMNGMRLSSKGHWDVGVMRPDGRVLHVFASHPAPPVFDGPEDLNGLRNAAEISFWAHYLDGFSLLGETRPFDSGDFVILGDLNSDPLDGDSRHEAIEGLLTHVLVQDPMPRSEGARLLADTGHLGDPSLDTVDWKNTPGPGNLRVDYVLPSKSLAVLGSGVFWPEPNDPLAKLLGSGRSQASDHRLVWVDLE